MADITVTAAEVRPITGGCILQRMKVGTAVTRGQAVYIDSSGLVAPADADAEASSMAKGIVVSCGSQGATSAAAGLEVDVVLMGRVYLGSSASMTEGQPVYVSTTAGALDQTAPATAGDFPYIIGYAFSVNELFVMPQLAVPTVNS